MLSSLNFSTVSAITVRIPFSKMFRILTVAVSLGSFRILLAAEETCNAYIENVNCSDRDTTELLYICESGRTDNCSCILENPLRSEVGWFKTCRIKNSLKIRKKKVRKRQVTVQNFCGTISPPNPGKVSCFVSQTDIKCIGTCDPDYQFTDGEQEQNYSCVYSDGVWQPEDYFPSCEPKCNPPCENDGICSSVNFCSCPNNYRGNACQYPITLCGISKNKYASNWKCNHTRTETSCDISCYPPDTAEAELDVYRYECNVEGEWNPPLPPCVQVPQCEKPPSIMNGQWQLVIGHIFSIDSKIIYTCEDGFVLQGGRFIICKSNGSWSNAAPVCIQRQDICNDPGDVPHGRRTLPSLGFFGGSSVSYECLGNFVLLGDAVIKCMNNGQWSSRKPQCVPRENAPVFCPRPNAPRNSLIHVTFPSQHPFAAIFNKDIPMSQRLYVINFAQGQEREPDTIPDSTFVVGTRVQYKCKSRFYRLYGSEYQTCLSSRTWSGYQPACVPECGKSDSPKTPFIVNGDSTRIGQWPWQIGIAVKTHRGLQLQCGGVLIRESWILTAAHCVTKKLSNIPMDNRDLLVFCGKYYRNFEQDDEFVQVKQVRQIVIHEEYDFVNFDGDIALLQLEDAVELTTRVQPICLPTDDTTRENIRDGKKGIVIGWGLTENGRVSEAMKETVLPVVSHDRCEEAYREGLRSVTITRNMFCAGHESGLSDTCNGDSGGPYMFAVGLANDIRWYLEGLVSWGSESGCGKALRYSGFTKVGRFVPWINMFT